MFSGFWGLDDARRHRDRLFVFGDNDARRGLAGQAAIRGEPNAIGLATKRSPSHVAHAYYRCGGLFLVPEKQQLHPGIRLHEPAATRMLCIRG